MNTLLIFMIKAAVYIAGFFFVYRIFLSRDTLYMRNRTYLLLSAAISMILPFFTIQTNSQLNLNLFGKVVSEIFISGKVTDGVTAASPDNGTGIVRWIVIIYFAGALTFGLKLLVDLLELAFLIGKHRQKDDHIIRFSGLNTAGFSAFGHIFISSSLSSDEADEIRLHEQNHINNYHSFDIIFIELILIFQWFNPFAFLLNRSLRAVHEYQADESCLNLGTTVKNYQKLLLSQVFQSKIFNVTNSFSNPSLVRKRMIMMTRKRSRSMANLKLLAVLPVISVLMFIISSCSQGSKITDNQAEMAPPPPPPPPAATNSNSDSTYVVVDEFPVFPGGEEALIEHVMRNTSYPAKAKEKGIQGKVIIKFVVEPDGSIDNISVLKSVDPELDREAIRVVSLLPPFEKPGIKNGKPVPVWYMVPFNFTLK